MNKKLKTYLVSADETLYYLSKEIEAKSREEAKEKYLKMVDDGIVEVNDSEMMVSSAEEVKK